MAVTRVASYQVTPEGKRQTRRVVTENGTPGEIADVLAGEHRCRPQDIVIHGQQAAAGAPVAPQTTGLQSGPLEDPPPPGPSVTMTDGSDVPSTADINGMRKAALYDLAALHGVPVDDDPSVADLKSRLVTKLHG